MTHKGAAADSGHYIGFVKKSVFYAAKAKVNGNFTTTVPEELRNLFPHTSFDSPESVAAIANPLARSLATSITTSRPFDPSAVTPGELARLVSEFGGGEQEQGEPGQGEEGTITDSTTSAPPIPGPSTLSASVALELEDDEDWYKFDDEKVTDFPKEKLPSLEGGGEDSSAYVLVYRSKLL